MVCDWWECKYFRLCRERNSDRIYPPCAVCVQFDACAVCSRYVECSELITRYLPDMFRRLVREIRLGEDTEKTQQIIRRNTLGGKKRG